VQHRQTRPYRQEDHKLGRSGCCSPCTLQQSCRDIRLEESRIYIPTRASHRPSRGWRPSRQRGRNKPRIQRSSRGHEKSRPSSHPAGRHQGSPRAKGYRRRYLAIKSRSAALLYTHSRMRFCANGGRSKNLTSFGHHSDNVQFYTVCAIIISDLLTFRRQGV
jgi:hypothetical protein